MIKKWILKLIFFFFIVSASLIFLSAVLLALLQVPRFKEAAIASIKSQIETQTGYHIQLDKLQLEFPLNFSVAQLVISNDERILLHADEMHFSLSWMHLLRGGVVIKTIDVLNLLLDTDLYSFKLDPSKKNSFIFPLYWSLQHAHIHNFSAKESTRLHPYLKHLELNGNLNLRHAKLFNLTVKLTHQGESPLPQEISLHLNSSPLVLSAALYAYENERGNSILKIPYTKKIEIHLTLSAPWEIWDSLVSSPHHPSSSIHGQLAIKTDGKIQTNSQGNLHFSPQGKSIIDHCTTQWKLEDEKLWQTVESSGFYEIDTEILQLSTTIEELHLTSIAHLLNQPIEGIINAQIHLEGSLDSLEITANASSQKVIFNQISYEALNASLSTNIATDLNGEAALNARVFGSDYHLSTPFSWKKDKEIYLQKITLSAPGLSANGQLKYDFESSLFLGGLKGDISDFHSLDELFNGSGHFELSLDHPEKQRLLLEAELKDIEYSHLQDVEHSHLKDVEHSHLQDVEHSHLTIDSISLKFQLNEISTFLNGNLTVKISEMALGMYHLDHVDISSTIDTSLPLSPISLTIHQSNLPTGVSAGQLTGSGGWRKNTDSADLIIDQLSGELYEIALFLDQPFSIHLAPQEFLISPLKIHMDQGYTDIELNKKEDRLNGHITLHHIPMQLISILSFSDLRMNGYLDLQSRLEGSFDDLKGDLIANFKNVKIEETIFSNLKPIQGTFKGQLKDNKLQLQGAFSAFDNHPFNFYAAFPLSIHPSLMHFYIPVNAPIVGHLEAKGEVESLLKLIVTDTTNISGFAEVKIDVGGSLDEPSITGKALLSNGTYESLDTGGVFKNLQLLIEGDGRVLRLKELRADDALSGSLSMTGEVLLDKELKFPHAFNISLNNARLIHQDYASANGTGNLTLKGNSESSLLAGPLKIDAAHVVIPEKTPPQFHRVDVLFVTDREVESGSENTKKNNWPISMDLEVSIPQTAFLEGRHLESLWKGNVRLSGSADKPLLNGTMEIVKGSYDLHGHTFNSRLGMIQFAGDPAHKSTIYVSAERQIEQNRIEVIVSGALSDPEIRFRSNPPMSEKEILSWILFNRGISDITAHEGKTLQQSSITISGGKGDDDLLSQIRNHFGIDRLDLNTNEGNALNPSGTNEVSLRVGKYFSKGVFVSINKSINAEANQLALEANLARYWKLQAEVGDNAEGKFIIKWERDY